MLDKINRLLIKHPDIVICSFGALFAVIFYVSAIKTEGHTSDLLLNLAASMVTVSLTVFLVDKVRELNIQRRKAGSRNDAIAQIKSAHIGLVMMLVLNSVRPINEFRDDFLKAGNKANNAQPKELDDMWIKYARKLSELNNQQILKHQRDDKLNLVGNTVERLEASLTSTLNLYEFSLDLEVRAAVVTMISKLSTFKSSFSIAELDDLEKITNATPKFLIAITAVDYLQSYNRFLDLVEAEKTDVV